MASRVVVGLQNAMLLAGATRLARLTFTPGSARKVLLPMDSTAYNVPAQFPAPGGIALPASDPPAALEVAALVAEATKQLTPTRCRKTGGCRDSKTRLHA
jgi:hypothetical protein